MNDCTNLEIQEMLPDLLHGSLAAADKTRLEKHVAGCAECAEELRVLSTVKSAAVFAPEIDAARIAQNIPPYRLILPATQQPVRSRMWLTAAAAIVLATVGGLLTLQNSAGTPGAAVASVDSSRQVVPSVANPGPVERASVNVASAGSSVANGHALALAADVDGLSDGSLVQLMDEMAAFDGLPAAEPEPMLAVDTGENSAQD